MEKMKLTDAWSVSGNGSETLKEVIEDVASRTEILPFCNRTFAENDGVYTLESYEEEKDRLVMTRTGHNFAALGKLKAKVPYAKELVSEALSTTCCVVRNENNSYFLSEYAYLTLTQRVGMGTSIADSCFERDRFLERRMKNGSEDWMVCVRKDGLLKKIFAVFTSQYAAIPQTTVTALVEQFEKGTDLGAGIVGNWTVSHAKTQVDIAFPDAAAEISRTYGKPEVYTPTIRIITSDVGYHPFGIQALFVKSSGAELLIKEQNIRHRGKKEIDLRFVMNKVLEVLFPEFTKLPKQLMALTMMPVDDPEKFIDTLAKKGSFVKVLSKDLTAKMTGLLKGTINPAEEYNAYDIVSMFMELPERLGGIPEYLTEPFSRLCAKIPYIIKMPMPDPVEPELYLK